LHDVLQPSVGWWAGELSGNWHVFKKGGHLGRLAPDHLVVTYPFLIKGSLDEKLPSYELLKMLKETDQ